MFIDLKLARPGSVEQFRQDESGQLGSELNRLLPELGEVIALERKDLDLLDPEEIRRVMRGAKPQLVVNAAAYTAVDAAETDRAKAFAVNAERPAIACSRSQKDRCHAGSLLDRLRFRRLEKGSLH